MRHFRRFRIGFAFLGLGLGLYALKGPVTQAESPLPQHLPSIIFVAAPVVRPGALEERFPQGSHLARYSPGAPPSSAVNLTPEFFAAADPQVSFDASHVLFSGRKTRGGKWQIWEMKADGSAKRQLTEGTADCLRPAYLPRHQIVFTRVAGKGRERSSAIYVAQADGSQAHAITFGPGDFQVETVLESGRILVSAKPSLVAGGQDGAARWFYTLRPDGTGLMPFRGHRSRKVIQTGAQELTDGTVLFVERQERAGRETGGRLAWIAPGALHHSIVPGSSAGTWSAHQLDGSRWVVARKGSEAGLAGSNFALYAFDAASKTPGRLIYRNPRLSSVQAVPLEPHRSPLDYFSILHPTRDYGRVICLDAYLSADVPHGRVSTPIARVRVMALEPDHRHQRVLGEAPVESDGSFYIKVPADIPIRFETLSPTGAVIRSQKSWIWARTGEDVPCIGCHESKALVPQNHWPLALKRFDTPIPVGLSSPSSSKQR